MYTEIRGAGRDLLLLHGGSGSIADLDGLRSRLVATHRVLAPDQRGHGRTADPGALSYAAMAADTAALLDALGLREVDVVGWSDGGIVGLMLAVDRPDLVRRVVPIGANVADIDAPNAVGPEAADWLAAATASDLMMPEADSDLPGRAETAERLLDMWRRGPELTLAGLTALNAPVLFVSGDRDIVTLEHTIAMYRAVPGAQLAVVPGTDHGVVQTHVDAVARLVLAFIDAEAP
jgi:pimeloyl-ACP methyl ester carboxylesterase